MKILIIPEDQTQDGFIAKPIVDALREDLGIPGKVWVLPEPRLRGAGDALDPDVVRSIVADNPTVDLFVLIVDRDCDRQGHEAKAAAREREHPGKVVACVAFQELEVWMLALHRENIDARWQDIRSHCDPKEEWAAPLLRRLGADGPGAGRKRAMRALQGQLSTLLSLCTELSELKNKIIRSRQSAP